MTSAFQRALQVAAVLLAALAAALSRADSTWTYSVQVHASVQAVPARVTLAWPTDHLAAKNYTVWRKQLDEHAWTRLAALPPEAQGFVDESVALGGIYEYQIEKESASAFSAWGYIAVGVNAPLMESRGKVILVVDNTIADAVGGELRRLERDLIGDGWGVIRKNVGRNDSPESVRNQIRAEWEADRANVRAVFLFGHVPVPKSGRVNIDGHRPRAMPADVYYGEMDGHWTDADQDGVLDQNSLPSDAELQVGRVDFADLPGAYAATPFPGEVELLRRYLDKDHRFRHAQVRPPARALIGNRVGDAWGQAPAASAYRAFAALVGPENIVEAGIQLETPPADRWMGKLANGDYLWAFGAGAGGHYSLGGLGNHAPYNDLWGSDFIEQRARGTFYMFFGSWVCEWDVTDNLMRTALAAPDHGLTAVWSGRPHFYFHPMGVGLPIGHAVRLSQNNNGLIYRTHVQRHARAVHIALMGDPTLRQDQVAPPGNVQASASGAEVTLTWSPSADSVFGYRVYRSAFPGAPFEPVSGELHGETRFVDRPPNPSEATYMVRAVTLQLGPSGSYYNASQGVFSRADFSIPNRAPSNLPEPARSRITGIASEVGADIRHQNGNIYDQVLLQGPYASVGADGGQIVRVSFLDPDDDIVQVELSGSGSISLLLDEGSGPETPGKYNQGVAYMKGRAIIGITGANASTHVSIFSVGRANALNPALFRDVSYDGIADIALLTVSSLDGKFGGLRTANVRFSATKGLTGIYASDIQFSEPVLIGDVDAQGAAEPVIHLGAANTDSDKANEVRIAGGDLVQSNNRVISISGITRIQFNGGQNSHGTHYPAQSNRGRFELGGEDVTSRIVVNP
jgi:hypothetical protein